MNEVLIEVGRLVGRLLKGRLPTGVDRVGLAYVAHFSDRARAVVRLRGRTMVLPADASRRLFACLLAPSAHFRLTMIALLAREFFSVRSCRSLRGAIMLHTGHSGLEQAGYLRYLRKHGIKLVVLVHDLIPISHPEYSRPGERYKHVVRMRNVLELGSGVIANSQATLDHLERFARAIGQSLPPSSAAPLAAAVLPLPSPVRPVAEPYFVVLSTIEPRKNHLLLLQLWRRLVERLGTQAPKLVIIGQRGWECENVVDLLERCECLRGAVIELPACSDASLSGYLRHAQALLFPSFSEGYGMPLVEAIALGTPVIASDLPVFREIAGAIPEYLDPLDGLGWIEHIEAYADPDSPRRAAQLQRMDGFVPSTWRGHFLAVEALMERLR